MTSSNMEDSEEQELLKRKNGGTCMSCRLALSFFACTVGSSFQFGFNTGVINAPQNVIENFLNATSIYQTGSAMTEVTVSIWWSSVVSVWIVGGMIGGLSGGALADKFGRKGSLLWTNVFVLVGGVLMVVSKYAQSGIVLAAGRFIVGIHSGVSTAVAPMYLSEVSPVKWRGFAGTLNQFTIVFALLISEILGLSFIMGNDLYWNILLGLVLVPAVLQMLLFPWCPESPRYLYLNQQRGDKALVALQWLHGYDRAEYEMRELEQEQHSTRNLRKMSARELLLNPALRLPLIVSIMLQVSQQLTGVNAINYYSTRLFEDAGLSVSLAQYATLGSGSVMLIMTFISAILVDRAGRRTLQLTGLGGEWVFAILITVALSTSSTIDAMKYVIILAVFGFVIFFAVGPGSIPWFMVSEMFTQSQRGAAVSVAVFINWLANFIVGISFPSLERVLQSYSFLPFIGILTIVWIYLFLKLPETKNKTVPEIYMQMVGRKIMEDDPVDPVGSPTTTEHEQK